MRRAAGRTYGTSVNQRVPPFAAFPRTAKTFQRLRRRMDRETLVDRLTEIDGIGESRANEVVDVLADAEDEDGVSDEVIRNALTDIDETAGSLSLAGKSGRARVDRIRETTRDLRALLAVGK